MRRVVGHIDRCNSCVCVCVCVCVHARARVVGRINGRNSSLNLKPPAHARPLSLSHSRAHTHTLSVCVQCGLPLAPLLSLTQYVSLNPPLSLNLLHTCSANPPSSTRAQALNTRACGAPRHYIAYRAAPRAGYSPHLPRSGASRARNTARDTHGPRHGTRQARRTRQTVTHSRRLAAFRALLLPLPC